MKVSECVASPAGARKPAWIAAVSVLAAALYAVLSLVIFGSDENWLTTFIGVGPDPMTYIWGLNWWPWAIWRGIYPMVSHYVWYPSGFNMAWADMAPSAALMALPITLVGNAVLAYNVLMVAAPVAAATSAFVLVRYYTRDTLASLFAGYLFGFSSYQIAHGTVHLSLALTFLIPIIVLLCAKRLIDGMSRRRFIGALVICLLLQFGISMEVFATTYFFGAIAFAALLAFAPRQRRGPLCLLMLDVGLATAIVGLLSTPWLVSMYHGRSDVPPIINDPGLFGTDALNFVIPTELTWIGSIRFSAISDKFTGGIAENNGYLGLPLIAILILWSRESWRTYGGRTLLSLILVSAAMSVGPALRVGGHLVSTWTPSRALIELPLIRHALPGRFALYVALAAAVAAGFWLSAARTAIGRSARFALGLLAIVFIFPNLDLISWTEVPSVPFFDRKNPQWATGQTPNLIVLPFRDADTAWPGPSMIWQWQSGMAFTQSGGYLGNPPPGEYAWAAVRSFDKGEAGPNFANDVTAYAVAHRVDAIVAGPDTQPSLLTGLDNLGWKQEESGDVRIYHVPASSNYLRDVPASANDAHFSVSGDYWPSPAEWNWMGGSVTIAATGGDFLIKLSGVWRPPALGPAVVQVAQDGKTQSATVAQGKTVTIRLAAGHDVTLTTASVFIPQQYLGNGDPRSLSVLLHITR
jgi:hypothetical protein